ncbi:hypothetical protein EW026_g7757 [Hermanssonia centrifuga]|uniref:DUF6532 domain-containing protein n=1 Tax=Hermanssonia centrifuga TaxID=98765 RepID=A0A4V3X9B0_9APHY|nr:hypothetical protein EW026_g7757 [Hermanssonia centrifuga]
MSAPFPSPSRLQYQAGYMDRWAILQLRCPQRPLHELALNAALLQDLQVLVQKYHHQRVFLVLGMQLDKTVVELYLKLGCASNVKLRGGLSKYDYMPRSRRVLSSDESGSGDEAANVNSKKANKKSLHIAGETPIETTKRVRKATEKQLYSEQAKENEQGKQIKKLQHELDRLKKQKRTAQHTNDNDSSRLGDEDMSDLPPESEEEDNYVSPLTNGAHDPLNFLTPKTLVARGPVHNHQVLQYQKSSNLMLCTILKGGFRIKAGIKKFLLKIYTVHPFPADEMALGWAATAWSDICTQLRKNFSQQDSDRVITLIMKRASSARGHLRDEISELIVEFYKIKLETGRKKVREENEQRIHYLMEGSPKRFCYKDYDRSDPRGYAEVEFCLDTWATGEFNSQVTFKESEYRPRYETHLEQLKQWEEINSVVVQKIREKMFERIV